MGVERGVRPIEPWRALAHGLLIHGRELATGALTQERFWPLCQRVPGRAGAKATYTQVTRTLGVAGSFFCNDDVAIGPDTFCLTGSAKRIRFGPGMGLVLGISLGTESLRAGLVDANGWLLEATCPPPGEVDGVDEHERWHAVELTADKRQTEMSPAMLLDRIALAAGAVCARALRDPRLLVRGALPLFGVAVAWPAPVGRDKELNGTSFSHWQWQVDGAPPVTHRVAARLGLPTERSHAVNDANAVAMSVAFDDIRRRPEAQTRTLLALRVGGGLGAGTCVVGRWGAPLPRSMFLGTRLIEGDGGFAGELGHLPVDEQHVREINELPTERGLEPMPRLDCSCGRPDPCLQTYASATAFVERLKLSQVAMDELGSADAERGRTSVMHEFVSNARDRRQLRAKRDIGRMIGRALASPVLMLNPSLVAVSGSMAAPETLAGIEDERRRWAHAHSEGLRVIGVGDDIDSPPHRRRAQDLDANRYAAVRGAALVVLRRQLYHRFDTLTPPFDGLTLKLTPDAVAAWRQARRAGGARG